MRLLLGVMALLVAGCGARTGLPELQGQDAGAEAPIDAMVEVEDTADTGPVGCVPGTIVLDRATPAVMWVLDRSGSMAEPMTTTVGRATRWEVLTRALASTLPPVDATMKTGALLYPTTTTGGSVLTCAVSSTVDLAPKAGNVGALIDRMKASRPRGATPTAAALEVAATQLLSTRAATTARTIVLATDGAPGCNTALDPATCRCSSSTMSCRGRPTMCLDDVRTIATIAKYQKLRVPTFVIGIHAEAETAFDDVLDGMAIAGGRARTGASHRYYAVTSEAELDAALVAIRDQVGACTYLTTSVPSAGGKLVVLIDGVPVPQDPAGLEGWTWSDEPNGQILLTGTACSRAAAAAKVVAQVECGD